MRRLGPSLLIVALAAALSCDKSVAPSPPPGSGPGRVTLFLETPHVDDGAIVIEITGSSVGTPVLADTSMWMFTDHVDSRVTRVVIVGNLTTGALLGFDVPDSVQPYMAAILQVSDRANVARASLQGYKLDLSR
jgi:hypothetical protein